MFRSFRYRNYRLYFIGQTISMAGTWMQTMAQMWLVYRLSHSSLLLGLVGFAGQTPVLFFGLFGGVAADRYNRRVTLLWTQVLALLQALLLAILTLKGAVQVWHVFILAVALGLINVFDMPARQAFVVELVAREDLGNAIALNTFIVNSTRLIGPMLAGFIVDFSGEGLCFLLNAVSYVAVIFCLIQMKLPHTEPGTADTLRESWDHMKAGLRYAFAHPRMKTMLTLLSLISLAGVPFMTLMPIFTDTILYSGAKGLGYLMGASGIGSLISSWMLASRRHTEGLPHLTGVAVCGFGASLALFALSRSMTLSLAAMTLTGWSMMTAFTGCNTMLQSLTSDAMRGRVMGLFSMTFMGVAPIGNLLSGVIADRIGAPITVFLGGCVCVLCGLIFLKNEKVTLAVDSVIPAPSETSPRTRG